MLKSISYRIGRLFGRLLNPLKPTAQRMLGRSGSGSAWYYALFSPAFRREQAAFQAGVRRYHKDLNAPESGMALLRRNTHRLEKGLLMRPRREIFAKDYIGETVDCYVKYAAGCTSGDPELQWAGDVLKTYFDAVGSEPKIDAARDKFQSANNHACEANASAEKMVPYQRDLSQAPSVSYDAMRELAMRRRSVRWFQEKPVDRAILEKALDVATQAPSACNRQPFVFRIFDDPELVQKVAALPGGTGGYRHNIPVIIVIVGQQRNYFDERDRHLIYIDGSLAAMSFIFAIESQGLSTCCINWPDVEHLEQKMADLIGLTEDERPVMCLAVGHPDPSGMVAYSQKKTGPQLRQYNFEDESHEIR